MMLSYYYRITALKIRRFRDLLFINMIKPYMETVFILRWGLGFSWVLHCMSISIAANILPWNCIHWRYFHRNSNSMVVRFFPVIEILRKRSAHDTAGMLSWRVGRFHAIDTQAWYYGKVNIPSNLNYDETDVSEMSFWTQMSQIIHEC